jgi:hypothetical protein
MINLTLDADTPDTTRLSVNAILTRSKKTQKKCRVRRRCLFCSSPSLSEPLRAHPENPICKRRSVGAGYPHREGKIAWHASDIVSPASRIGGR